MSATAVTLICFLFVQGVEIFLIVLNMVHLTRQGGQAPPGFQERVDAGALRRMIDYSVARGKSNIIEAVYTAIITFFFTFGGGLNWYNSLFADALWPQWVSGTIFFLLVGHAAILLHIPFSLYDTFQIEKKFGFSTQGLRLWCFDILKSLFLSTIIYGVLAMGTFFLIGAFPRSWWIAAWGFFFCFSILILYLSPLVIEPFFNTFTPLDDPFLEKEIQHLMQKAGIAVSQVQTMDSSRRSTHTNAYFSGIGRMKRIVLFDTLLKKKTKRELLAILAHEAGHWKRKHLLKRVALMEIVSLILLGVAYHAVQGDFLIHLFHLDAPTLYAKLLLFLFLASIVLFPLKPFGNWLSRRQEREADRLAVEFTRDSEALRDALVGLARDNLSNLHPHPLYALFHYSHPPFAERVASLGSPEKGEVGK